MIVAGDRVAAYVGPIAKMAFVWAICCSVALHFGVIGFWLLQAPQRLRSQDPIVVELIQQAEKVPGAGADLPAPMPLIATSIPPVEARPSNPPNTSQDSAPSPSPAIHFGNTLDDVLPLIVTGKNITPATPDSRYRNQPPSYPSAAARAHAEGTVQLLIHVSAAGLVIDVDVLGSSGNQALDTSAREAVSRWRFKPARTGSRAVPTDYPINIQFKLGGN